MKERRAELLRVQLVGCSRGDRSSSRSLVLNVFSELEVLCDLAWRWWPKMTRGKYEDSAWVISIVYVMKRSSTAVLGMDKI